MKTPLPPPLAVEVSCRIERKKGLGNRHDGVAYDLSIKHGLTRNADLPKVRVLTGGLRIWQLVVPEALLVGWAAFNWYEAKRSHSMSWTPRLDIRILWGMDAYE